jgi:hypothetical protein
LLNHFPLSLQDHMTAKTLLMTSFDKIRIDPYWMVPCSSDLSNRIFTSHFRTSVRASKTPKRPYPRGWRLHSLLKQWKTFNIYAAYSRNPKSSFLDSVQFLVFQMIMK